MRKKILAYIIAVLTITTCMIQLIPRQNNIFKIASQGEGESGFLTNNNLNQKKVYLTFDDGPSDHTDEILDILKKNKVRATFFVVGKETEHAKKMYRRIILEGHTLGMHSYSHNYDQIYASVGAFSKDLMKLQKYLYDLTEVKSYIYRFPGGSSNHCAGDIKPYIRYVLMHDLHETKNTVKGLDSLIKTLKKEGYQILPITTNTKPIHHVSIDK